MTVKVDKVSYPFGDGVSVQVEKNTLEHITLPHNTFVEIYSVEDKPYTSIIRSNSYKREALFNRYGAYIDPLDRLKRVSGLPVSIPDVEVTFVREKSTHANYESIATEFFRNKYHNKHSLASPKEVNFDEHEYLPVAEHLHQYSRKVGLFSQLIISTSALSMLFQTDFANSVLTLGAPIMYLAADFLPGSLLSMESSAQDHRSLSNLVGYLPAQHYKVSQLSRQQRNFDTFAKLAKNSDAVNKIYGEFSLRADMFKQSQYFKGTTISSQSEDKSELVELLSLILDNSIPSKPFVMKTASSITTPKKKRRNAKKKLVVKAPKTSSLDPWEVDFTEYKEVTRHDI